MSKGSEIPAENPLQKDLDAKSKEVITLKVCHAMPYHHETYWHPLAGFFSTCKFKRNKALTLSSLCRTNISAP